MKGPGRWAMRPTLVPVALALDAVFQQLTDDTGKPCPTPHTPPHPGAERTSCPQGRHQPPVRWSQSWPGCWPPQASGSVRTK